MSDHSDKGNVLTHVFSKNRRDKKGVSPADSVRSTSTATTTTTVTSEGNSLRRGSAESLKNKIKGQDLNGVASGLKKLVPSSLGSKRRQKREDEEAQRLADEEATRGRRVAERGVLNNESSDTNAPLHFLREDSGESQLTDESEEDL